MPSTTCGRPSSWTRTTTRPPTAWGSCCSARDTTSRRCGTTRRRSRPARGTPRPASCWPWRRSAAACAAPRSTTTCGPTGAHPIWLSRSSTPSSTTPTCRPRSRSGSTSREWPPTLNVTPIDPAAVRQMMQIRAAKAGGQPAQPTSQVQPEPQVQTAPQPPPAPPIPEQQPAVPQAAPPTPQPVAAAPGGPWVGSPRRTPTPRP